MTEVRKAQIYVMLVVVALFLVVTAWAVESPVTLTAFIGGFGAAWALSIWSTK